MRYVFIHGAGCCSDVYSAQREAFPDSLAVDLTGHGGRPGHAESIETFADALAADLDRLNLKDAALCGHSMGGAVALELALRRQPGVKALVLLGSGARLRVAPAVFAELTVGFEGAVGSLVHHSFATPTNRLAETTAAMFLATGLRQTLADFRACDAFDRTDRLGELTLPVLAVTGAQDILTPPKYAQLIADRVPGAEVRIVEGAGHFAMIERPDETNDALRAFLKRIENAA